MPPRLLIAEDSRTQRETLRLLLEAAGYEVLAAADGREALEALACDDVDLLISDVVMPTVDGYELCQKVKQRCPRLPVILLTSMTDPLEVVRGLQSGADNFLRKPYDSAVLLTRIQTMLHTSRLREEASTRGGLEVLLRDQRFTITAEREQILDLLLSTFEDLVATNGRLRQQEAELLDARDELERRLRQSTEQKQRLDAVLASVPEAMVVIDADNRVTAASRSLAALAGAADAAALCGTSGNDLLAKLRHAGDDAPIDPETVLAALAAGRSVHLGSTFDLLGQRADGEWTPMIFTAAPVVDPAGKATGAVAIVHEIEALGAHDPLTHLPTHRGFVARVDAAVEHSVAHGGQAKVLVIVLDRGEELRDGLGSERVDRLAVELAGRVRVALEAPFVLERTESPSAAYLGDSEFAVVLPRLGDPAQGVLVADFLRQRLAGPYRVDDIDLSLTFTVGCAATDDPTVGAAQLVPAAAAAAHNASRLGGDCVAASDQRAAELAAVRLREEADLRRALDQNELEVHYQPILTMAGAVAGCEALVRWQHPEKGFRSPAEFIPLAEATGLVVPLGWQVLQRACHQLATWRRELPGAQNLTVSVNVSPQQLAQGDTVEQVQKALGDTGLEPGALVLEITESGTAHEERVAEQLSAVRRLGVAIAIDDFGTGYSSLLQLRYLPIDILKIDRTFINGLLSDADDASIVAASLGLAEALGLRVVAEGVEEPAQAVELRRLGCAYAQGFLWSRPLPAVKLEQWFTEWLAEPAPAQL